MSLKRVIGAINGLIWGVKLNGFNEKEKEPEINQAHSFIKGCENFREKI